MRVVCCSVLQCVAVSVAVCSMEEDFLGHTLLRSVAQVLVLQCVAVCCAVYVAECVAVCSVEEGFH